LGDLQEWFGPESSGPLDEARVIVQEYDTLRGELYSQTEDRLREELRQAGIEGSAVKPKVEQDGRYQDELQKIKRGAEAELKKVKDRLSSVSG